MNKTVKDILGLLLIVLPFFGGMFAWWLYSPMYKDFLATERQNAREYLIKTYYFDIRGKDAMIEFYGFADEEINPTKLFEKLANENAN